MWVSIHFISDVDSLLFRHTMVVKHQCVLLIALSHLERILVMQSIQGSLLSAFIESWSRSEELVSSDCQAMIYVKWMTNRQSVNWHSALLWECFEDIIWTIVKTNDIIYKHLPIVFKANFHTSWNQASSKLFCSILKMLKATKKFAHSAQFSPRLHESQK